MQYKDTKLDNSWNNNTSDIGSRESSYLQNKIFLWKALYNVSFILTLVIVITFGKPLYCVYSWILKGFSFFKFFLNKPCEIITFFLETS